VECYLGSEDKIQIHGGFWILILILAISKSKIHPSEFCSKSKIQNPPFQILLKIQNPSGLKIRNQPFKFHQNPEKYPGLGLKNIKVGRAVMLLIIAGHKLEPR